jgi:hypothetical protein
MYECYVEGIHPSTVVRDSLGKRDSANHILHTPQIQNEYLQTNVTRHLIEVVLSNEVSQEYRRCTIS